MLDSNPHPLVPAVADTNRTALVVADVNVPPPGLSAAPTASTLLHAFRRRWLLALGVALLGAAGAVLAVLNLLPAQFAASARIQIAARSAANLFTPNGNEEPDFLIYKASMAALIKSPMVVNSALNQVKDLPMVREHAKPVEWLEKALKTDFLLAPEIMRLTLEGDNPEEVTKIVNAVADAFLKEMENKERVKRQGRLEELKESQRLGTETLHQKRQALRNLIAAHHLDDPDVVKARYQQSLGELSTARKTLLDKHLELVNAEEEIKAMQDNLKHIDQVPVSSAQVEEYLKQDPAAQEILRSLALIERTMADIQKTASHPMEKIKYWEDRRSDQTRRLDKLRKLLRPGLEQRIRLDMADKFQAGVLFNQDKMKSLKKQEEIIGLEIMRREKEADALKNPFPLSVQALRDEIASMETSQNKLNEMIAAIKAEPLLGRITLLQRAEVPAVRDYSKQFKVAGAGSFALFGLLLFGVSWWEFRARRISDADEVVQGLKMNLVGTLPTLPERARRPVPGNTATRDLQWQGRLTEAVDAIRTLLLHAARTESLHVVMVTSAQGGEGKTSLASQLAASLARAWRKTLLVDGDLRNPAAHKLFGLAQEPGLSEVLRGEIPAVDTIRATSLSRLWLMPAGHWDSHAVQALAQEGVRAMFEQFKEQYDFIIVDSCPVLPVADALLLSQHVDAVLFSILRDVSRVPSVYAAQQKLHNLGIRTLGAVVIGDQAQAGSISYQYQAQAV